MMDTQQQTDIAKRLQEAVVQAAMPNEEDAIGGAKKAESKRRASPKNGVAPPATGRPKGTPNKTTATIREAVMQAFEHVGGWTYLVDLARGTQSDRAAFTSLLNKVLPTQINANVEGGIQVQLSWLGQRQIGATAAQTVDATPEKVVQVIDLERDEKGKYRIANPNDTADGVSPPARQGHKGAGDAQDV